MSEYQQMSVVKFFLQILACDRPRSGCVGWAANATQPRSWEQHLYAATQVCAKGLPTAWAPTASLGRGGCTGSPKPVRDPVMGRQSLTFKKLNQIKCFQGPDWDGTHPPLPLIWVLDYWQSNLCSLSRVRWLGGSELWVNGFITSKYFHRNKTECTIPIVLGAEWRAVAWASRQIQVGPLG